MPPAQPSAHPTVMPDLQFKHTILDLLREFRGIENLKQLVLSELNYDRANQTLSRRNWPDGTERLLAEDPLLLATGGTYPRHRFRMATMP
jgi:hypothetical protein